MTDCCAGFVPGGESGGGSSAASVVVDPNTIGGDGSAVTPLSVIGVRAPYNSPRPADWANWIDDPARLTDLITLFLRNSQNDVTKSEAITLQVDNNSTHDCTAGPFTAEGIEVFVTGSKTAGAFDFINSAITANAAGGDQNLCFFSVQGHMRVDDAAFFGAGGGGLVGFTVGPGIAAPAGGIQLNGNVAVEPSKAVSLGQNVESYIMPGTALAEANIRIGLTAAATPVQLAVKNTALGEAGVNCHIDTTINANARGGFVIFRGAGGNGELAGLNVPGGAGHYASGAIANDCVLWSYDPASAGRRIVMATGTSVGGPVVHATLDGAGVFTADALQTGNAIAGTGAKWTSGAGVPVAPGNPGDLYSNTIGGVGTSFYVYNGAAWTPLA